MRRLVIPSVASWLVCLSAGGLAEMSESRATLTIEKLLAIRHPSSGVWSPDGRRIAFIWDEGRVQNVWVLDVGQDQPGDPRDVTRQDTGLIEELFWSKHGRVLFFARGGDLWQVSPDGSTPPVPVWTTEEGEGGIALSPEGERVAFTRRGDIWVRSLADGSETRLTDTPVSESGPVWSPDGAHIAFVMSKATRRAEPFEYHGGKILFTWMERDRTSVGIVSAETGKLLPAAATTASESAPSWLDARRLVLQRITENYKAREIVLTGVDGGGARVLHRDVDEKWWGLTYNGATPTPSPDGRWIAFLSDRDGWDHLYLVTAGGRPAVQLTRGAYDVSRVAWAPDSRRLAFDVGEVEHPGRKQLAAIDLDITGAAVRQVTLTSGRGTSIQPIWSPQGDRILYQRTDPWNSSDYFLIQVDVGEPAAATARLTVSMPADIDREALVEPRLVRYPSADGKSVPANLFVPHSLDLSRQHPAIIWIHGDIVTQNYDGWHVRRDYAVYYSFHQYLLQRGYVVLAPDYRGSTGYGRDWRQGVYRDLGGKEYQDVAAGVEYLKTLGYVDTSRIGVWGLSYGGFLTLQALTVTPTLFRCGVNVAGVTDYGDYRRDPGQPWLEARMGTPEDNPGQYEQAAPIRRAGLIVRPLLVLAGTADTNVPYEQSVRLVDALLKAGKDFEFMMYPGERHYFHRAHVLRDAWRRVERFFDAHLQSSLSGGPFVKSRRPVVGDGRTGRASETRALGGHGAWRETQSATPSPGR